MSTRGGDRLYEAPDNLELMERAHRYNGWLVSWASSRMRHARLSADFGAGLGYLSARVQEESGCEVLCIEPDPAQRVAIEGRGLRSVPDLSTTDDAALDVIFTFNVLEHIPEDDEILEDFARVLRDDGLVLIYVPALPWLFSSMDAKVGHVRRYSRGELVSKCRNAGFQIVDVRFVDSLGVVATLAYKVAGSRSGDLNPRAISIYDRFVFPASCALDRVLHRVLGKNLAMVARRSPRAQVLGRGAASA